MWRVVYIVAGVMCFSMVVDALATGDPFIILTSLAFFGFGGFVMLKVILRNTGSIELRDDGLLIDSYLATGFIRWDDFESAQDVRAMGVSYLGLTTRDPDAYIASRKEFPNLKHEGDRMLAGGFTRIMLALLEVLPPAKTGCNVLISVFGYSPLPKQFNEASLMAWSRENYGSNLLIHKMWLPEFDTLLKQLNERAVATTSTPVAHQMAPADSVRRFDPARATVAEPAIKSCPMCAERVQPDARICRFCRYSFDEDRMLPISA